MSEATKRLRSECERADAAGRSAIFVDTNDVLAISMAADRAEELQTKYNDLADVALQNDRKREALTAENADLRAKLERAVVEQTCTYSRETGNSEVFTCSVCGCEWTICDDVGENWRFCPCCGYRIAEVINEDERAEAEAAMQGGERT